MFYRKFDCGSHADKFLVGEYILQIFPRKQEGTDEVSTTEQLCERIESAEIFEPTTKQMIFGKLVKFLKRFRPTFFNFFNNSSSFTGTSWQFYEDKNSLELIRTCSYYIDVLRKARAYLTKDYFLHCLLPMTILINELDYGTEKDKEDILSYIDIFRNPESFLNNKHIRNQLYNHPLFSYEEA